MVWIRFLFFLTAFAGLTGCFSSSAEGRIIQTIRLILSNYFLRYESIPLFIAKTRVSYSFRLTAVQVAPV